ncbi:MAG: alpha/beta hydrolase, partial [Bacteroidetes bacterium]|nr:alpha/beta hydrolase [Bacteroidota bacterium]
YNVFMIDLRAHGSSEGRVTTIGYKESEEVKLAYNFVKEKGEQKIILFGISMGAVILPKAIVDYHIQPAGIIMEMPFASLQDHLEARARVLGFPDQPFAFLVTLWIGIERGFNSFSYKTSRYTSQMDTPVLLQWGAKDDYVLKHETDEIFENISSPEKKLSIFPDAGHESLLQNDADKWQQDVTGFLGSLH